MSKLRVYALVVLALGLVSFLVPTSKALAEEEEDGGYCVWCVSYCPTNANSWCQQHAPGCSAWFLVCSPKKCMSIYGTEFAAKQNCGTQQ
jgi:hypothetical protein